MLYYGLVLRFLVAWLSKNAKRQKYTIWALNIAPLLVKKILVTCVSGSKAQGGHNLYNFSPIFMNSLLGTHEVDLLTKFHRTWQKMRIFLWSFCKPRRKFSLLVSSRYFTKNMKYLFSHENCSPFLNKCYLEKSWWRALKLTSCILYSYLFVNSLSITVTTFYTISLWCRGYSRLSEDGCPVQNFWAFFTIFWKNDEK